MYNSVSSPAPGLNPPKATIAVCVPQPDMYLLDVPKLPPLAHADPVVSVTDTLNSSVKDISVVVKPP